MISTIDEYFFPTYRALKDYKEQQLHILIWVYEHLLEEPSTRMMIECFSEKGLYDQLAYHQYLIITASEFRSSELLNDYMHWRYNVIQSRHVSAKYLLLENQLWIKAIRLFLFEAYSNEFIQIYEVFQSKHNLFSQARLQSTMDSTLSTILIQQLFNALITSDEEMVKSIFSKNIERFSSHSDFLDSVIKPTMIAIGKAWETNIITVAKEHIATSLVERVWNDFIHSAEHKPMISSNGRAFVITPKAQLHKLGSKMVSQLLQDKHWEATQFELENDFTKVLNAVLEFAPRLIVISITMPIYLPLVQSFIDALKDPYSGYQGKIAIGGQALYRTENPIFLEHVDFQGKDLKEFENYLNIL